MASPRLFKPSESPTPNHAHTLTKKKKGKKEKRKHTNVKCYVKCSLHSEQISTISSLNVEKRATPESTVQTSVSKLQQRTSVASNHMITSKMGYNLL